MPLCSAGFVFFSPIRIQIRIGHVLFCVQVSLFIYVDCGCPFPCIFPHHNNLLLLTFFFPILQICLRSRKLGLMECLYLGPVWPLSAERSRRSALLAALRIIPSKPLRSGAEPRSGGSPNAALVFVFIL